MSSLLAKFRHRKNSSSASSTSAADLTIPQNIISQSRRSTEAARPRNAHPPVQDTVVIPRDSHRDATGHSPAFADELNRPQLPTTISNVNNTPPRVHGYSTGPEAIGTLGRETLSHPYHTHGTSQQDASSSTQRTSQSSQDRHLPHDKALPTLPELTPGLSVMSIPLLDSAPSPLPHVSSVDRSAIHQSSGRPDIVSSDDADHEHRQPHFPQVVPGSSTAHPPVTAEDIPDRHSSLRPTALKNVREALTATPVAPFPALRSNRDPNVTSVDHLASHLGRLAVTSQKPQVPSTPPDLPAIRHQRNEMVQTIAKSARDRKAAQGAVSPVGRAAFRAAGIEHKLDERGSVEVKTRWLEPVVQEHIIRREHTEFTTIINRDIHKYHIYPKIQPISDPNPIVLAPRHRIFFESDKQWHEVIGDEAAIAILGKDVFYHGKKTVREVRGKALPGFGEVTKMTHEEQVAHGLVGGAGRVLEREGLVGQLGDWREVGRYGTSSTRPMNLAEEEDGERTMGIAI